MPRQPKLAPGLAALALGLGLALGPAPRPAGAADAPKTGSHAPAARSGHATGVLGEAEEALEKAEHAVEDHEIQGGEPNPLELQPSLMAFTVVVFLLLLLVLGRFAWGPLLEALRRREEHLEHVLLETERARNESEQLLAEHRRRMAEAEDQVRALIEEGKRNAQALSDDMIRKAQAEAEASKQRAERDIDAAREQALADIRNSTADLAVSVAGRVLGRSLSGDDHRRLVESAINELPVGDARGGQPA